MKILLLTLFLCLSCSTPNYEVVKPRVLTDVQLDLQEKIEAKEKEIERVNEKIEQVRLSQSDGDIHVSGRLDAELAALESQKSHLKSQREVLEKQFSNP